MKFTLRYKKTFTFAMSLAVFGLSALGASAQPAINGRVSMADLGGEPAILRTNPFYASKYIFSDVKGLFLSNPLKKTDLQFTIFNQKGADLLKLSLVAPGNTTAFTLALTDYQRAAILATASFNRLSDDDVKVDDQKRLSEQVITHLKFIDDMRSEERSNQDEAVLFDLEETLTKSLVKFLVRMDATSEVVGELVARNAVVLDGFSDIRDAEIILRLAEKAELLGYSADSDRLFEASEELYSLIATRLWVKVSDGDDTFMREFNELSGTEVWRAKTVRQLIQIQPSLSDTLSAR